MSMRQPKDRRQTADSRRQKAARRDTTAGSSRRAVPACRLPSAVCRLLSSVFHICHLPRPEAPEELGGALAVEQGVTGLDEDEEAVARGEREVRRVEDRVVWLRQPV